MTTLRLCRFGCEIPIRANFGEFLGILTPEIVKLLFRPPEVRTFRGDARFEILLIKIGSAVSSVALFKYQHNMTISNYGGHLGRHLEFQSYSSLLKRLSTQKLLLVV